MIEVLIIMYYAILIATAWMLVVKYRRTHDSGVFWLGLALIVWPIFSLVLDYGGRVLINRITEEGSIQLLSFSQVTRGYLLASLSYFSRVIASILVLIAVANLYKKELGNNRKELLA